jgi:hypothetical protein
MSTDLPNNPPVAPEALMPASNTGTDAGLETTASTASAAKVSRVGTIVRWSARLTSIPILALVLVSLIPALASFSISPREDKILALCLCGICGGFLVGWKWPGLGGGITLASVGAMLMQGDNSLFLDPFSIAFGLQGILFLVAWLLNLQPAEKGAPVISWTKKLATAALALAAFAGVAVICRGPGPTPVSKDKVVFVGVWESGSGFRAEITSDGRANVVQDESSKVDVDNSLVAPGKSGIFNLYFRGEDRLEFNAGTFGASKVYHLDRRPHLEGKKTIMVLNGSEPYHRSRGIALVKKEIPATSDSKGQHAAARDIKSP